jgi:hypothetical protein
MDEQEYGRISNLLRDIEEETRQFTGDEKLKNLLRNIYLTLQALKNDLQEPQ